ncbi:MAG: hypothetical protein RL744_1737 [Pseudomonadota bacterium]|jgi:hypothetical protein
MYTKKQLAEKFKDLLEEGAVLSGKHDVYVETYVEKSNEQLNHHLSELMSYAQDVLAMPNVEQIIKKMRQDLRQKYGIKTQGNSPKLTIVVRYVVRSSRKTAHVYARVIQVAIDAKVVPADLPAFIKANGGIDRIRQKTVNADLVKEKETKQELLNENAIAYTRFYYEDCAKNPMATFNIPQDYEARIFDAARFGTFHYMICQVERGEYKVVGALPMFEELDNQMLIRLYNHLHSRGFYTDEEKASKEVARQGVIAWRKRIAEREALIEKERLEAESAAELKKQANQAAANDDSARIPAIQGVNS